MNTSQQLCEDYQRIEQAIRYLDTNFQHQPDLAEIAASVHLSEYHFQRLFTGGDQPQTLPAILDQRER
jgi:AraC family transcriptional regulator of adaptative response/methylated-DNA-[protein]-cysteine methyltransferase